MRDEPGDAAAALDQGPPRYSMYALDIAAKTEKKLADDVGLDAAVTKDGLVVFARRKDEATPNAYGRDIYALDPTKEKPIRLTPDDKPAESFHVDVARSKVIYVHDSTAYEVAAGGGEPKKVASAWRIAGATEDAVLFVDGVSSFNLWPLDGGDPRRVTIPVAHKIVAVSHGLAISKTRRDEQFHIASLAPAEKHDTADAGVDAGSDASAADDILSFGIDHDGLTLLRSDDVVFASVKKGEERMIFEVGAEDKKSLLKVRRIDISGFAKIAPDTLAVLACQDTDEDDSCGGFDEVDVCLIERAQTEGPIDIPTRKLPAALEGVAGKVAAVLEENDLKGARARYRRVAGDNYRVTFESPVDGPTSLEALRARVRAIQARVTELSGMPALEVSVDYANGYRAESRFLPKQKRYVTFCGVGAALVSDSKDFTLEVDPKVIHGGSASTCSGTVKNTGDAPLEGLDVVCSVGWKSNVVGRSKTKPSVIAPGAEAKYTTASFPYNQYGDAQVRISVMRGEEELAFENRFVKQKSTALFEAAEKLLPTTGLVYSYVTDHEGDYFVHVTATEAFAKQSPEKQAESCSSLAKEFAKIAFYSVVLPKAVIVRIYDRSTKKLVSTFAKGKLEAAAASPR